MCSVIPSSTLSQTEAVRPTGVLVAALQSVSDPSASHSLLIGCESDTANATLHTRWSCAPQQPSSAALHVRLRHGDYEGHLSQRRHSRKAAFKEEVLTFTG